MIIMNYYRIIRNIMNDDGWMLHISNQKSAGELVKHKNTKDLTDTV